MKTLLCSSICEINPYSGVSFRGVGVGWGGGRGRVFLCYTGMKPMLIYRLSQPKFWIKLGAHSDSADRCKGLFHKI